MSTRTRLSALCLASSAAAMEVPVVPGPVLQPTVLLTEFDGVHEPGTWDVHQHPTGFAYAVERGCLRMTDRTVGYGSPNQHLTRRGLLLDPRSAYSLECTFTIDVGGTEGDPSSFCFNFNIAGGDGELDTISCWSLPVDFHQQWPPSVMKFMGFTNGRFAQIGANRPLPWCRQHVEYRYRVGVNLDEQDRYRFRTVTVSIREGDTTHEHFAVDFSTYPYQPDYDRPVRVGVNTHGANWTMRDFVVRTYR
jgi:hypothetical protein